MAFRLNYFTNKMSSCQREAPVIIYQMGKVGSASVRDSLIEHGISDVYHVHRINPDQIRAVRQEHLRIHQPPPDDSVGERLYHEIIERDRMSTFISLVREPIARNISAFFQNFRRFTGFGVQEALSIPEKLASVFLDHYQHTVPLTWFDAEIKRTLTIDIFDHPFPKEQGFQVIRKNNFQLLIMKLETSDSTKEKAVRSFLCLDRFTLRRSNTGEKKDYSKIYHDFLEYISLPKDYVDLMYESKYTNHFYTTDEIRSFRKKWTISMNQKINQELSKHIKEASVRVVH